MRTLPWSPLTPPKAKTVTDEFLEDPSTFRGPEALPKVLQVLNKQPASLSSRDENLGQTRSIIEVPAN